MDCGGQRGSQCGWSRRKFLEGAVAETLGFQFRLNTFLIPLLAASTDLFPPPLCCLCPLKTEKEENVVQNSVSFLDLCFSRFTWLYCQLWDEVNFPFLCHHHGCAHIGPVFLLPSHSPYIWAGQLGGRQFLTSTCILRKILKVVVIFNIIDF